MHLLFWVYYFTKFTISRPLFLSISIILHSAEATNLFLRENGIEVLRAMQPQLQKKLSVEFTGIANQLLKHVPRESFLVD